MKVEKGLGIALGSIIGAAAGFMLVSEGPKAFESSSPSSLRGLGYEIAPTKEAYTLVMSTDRFPRWALSLTALPLDLARIRIVKACDTTVYEPTKPEYIEDPGTQTVRVSQIFETRNIESCFPKN